MYTSGINTTCSTSAGWLRTLASVLSHRRQQIIRHPCRSFPQPLWFRLLRFLKESFLVAPPGSRVHELHLSNRKGHLIATRPISFLCPLTSRSQNLLDGLAVQ